MTKIVPHDQPAMQDQTSPQNRLIQQLDFSTTQKQVDTLMKSVLHDTTLNENKIHFIKEQLSDQRYQINPKIIANKLLDFVDSKENNPLSELITTTEST